jgi:hypothetical protein
MTLGSRDTADHAIVLTTPNVGDISGSQLLRRTDVDGTDMHLIWNKGLHQIIWEILVNN